MRFGTLTDVGRERGHNEDSVLAMQLVCGSGGRRLDCGLFIVADGMGGAAAGEVASTLTVEKIGNVVISCLLKAHLDGVIYFNPGRLLQDAIEQVNQHVFMSARETPEFMGMGATCTTLFVCQGKAFLGQVGDSRAYLLRNGEIRQITRDHSWVSELVRDGRITEEEARTHPRKNVITRAIGSKFNVQVDGFRELLAAGDLLLSCSDGLTGMVPDPVIKDLLVEAQRTKAPPQETCERLVAKANEAGGFDNISVNLVEVEPHDIPVPPSDHVAFDASETLTWDEAVRLGLEDFGFEKVED
jgi:PPM family protein phosphatase